LASNLLDSKILIPVFQQRKEEKRKRERKEEKEERGREGIIGTRRLGPLV
jgi:hypothetical protein